MRVCGVSMAFDGDVSRLVSEGEAVQPRREGPYILRGLSKGWYAGDCPCYRGMAGYGHGGQEDAQPNGVSDLLAVKKRQRVRDSNL